MLKANRLLALLKSRTRASAPSLGARELSVLEMLWQHEPQRAIDVLAALGGESLSLSTVQSTLERLCRKGLLSRRKQSRAYYYHVEISREEVIAALIRDISEEIAGGEVAAMVSGFMDYIEDASPAMKSRLSKALSEPGDD